MNRTKIVEFVGNYKREGNKLFHPQSQKSLLIASRKQTTPNKPKYFLLQLAGKYRQYVSSLYPISDNEYKFDYQSTSYSLKMDEMEVNISLVKKQGNEG